MKPLTIEKVLASPKLPSLPAVAVEIIKLVQDPDVSLLEIAEVISNDGALTSKILKSANSSFYARARAVSKLSDALMVLGLRRVKALALGFSLVDDKRGKDNGFNYTTFWRRSLYAAVSARALSVQTTGVDPEEAFLGGLMHSLGVLALNQAVEDDYQELFASAGGDYTELLDIEDQAIGFNHAELGGRLGELWNLPPQLTAALRWFPTPDLADESSRALVACVSAGSAAADVFICETPGLAVLRYRDRCQQWFKMSPDESDGQLASIQTAATSMRGLLNLPEAESADISEILSQANEVLEELSFEAERENVQLEREVTQLAVEASTDVLTGLANRRCLMDGIGSLVGVALLKGSTLSYLMVDIDHFKRVNDSHGHPAGDVVLHEVAATLLAASREADLVGRYGGEEFGIVATDTDGNGAVSLGQRLRKAVEALEIEVSDGVRLKVTVSIGVATLDRSWVVGSPIEQLIAAADAALYEAKESGRNTVRTARVAAAA